MGEGAQPVAGLGVDIIEIERMERALGRTPRMRERLFSQTERAYAQGKARPAVHFALFFAAKEAVLKALGTGFAGMAFTDVEVDHDRYGRPVPVLHGRARELAEAQGVVEMQLSLSYTRSVGVASAVAIKEQDRPRKDERLDPRAELARQFKEVRALLDNMDERITQLDEDDAAADGLSAAPATPAALATPAVPATQEGTLQAAADDSQYAVEDDAQHAAEKETPHA
ncbi:MAG: holo-ACP synthase [Coriobacteriales bacterium]|jgi:holo-[acyl-carrier protein] synthase|nr:holo-ACP synthase [Coriobacteriales bacterium]